MENRNRDIHHDPIQVLIAPDKFKGTLTAKEVARHLADGVRAGAADLSVECRELPLADGGDGSVDAAIQAGFERIEIGISGLAGQPASTAIAFDGETAVVEVASTCGLSMASIDQSPLARHSSAFGEAIRAALTMNPKRLVLAMGGSATTDGGAGMLAQLGMRFLDRHGQGFIPSGGTLLQITEIDITDLYTFDGVELILASDVTNRLLGDQGAAKIYGPQKGATTAEVEVLETGLQHLVHCLEKAGLRAISASGRPGAGSAGGLGFGCLLLGAAPVSGADFFLDLLGFDEQVRYCEMVITGEGKMDAQSLTGKLPTIVARRAAPRPVIAVVGRCDLDTRQLYAVGIEQCHALAAMGEADCNGNRALSMARLHQTGKLVGEELKKLFG